mmetsp:Transcript_110451/g.319218  ORF Transcript_110451/g.319218 Transcript_110451/m.319218 type:complete len:224 (+) Transcript_110451:283-954(+)
MRCVRLGLRVPLPQHHGRCFLLRPRGQYQTRGDGSHVEPHAGSASTGIDRGGDVLAGSLLHPRGDGALAPRRHGRSGHEAGRGAPPRAQLDGRMRHHVCPLPGSDHLGQVRERAGARECDVLRGGDGEPSTADRRLRHQQRRRLLRLRHAALNRHGCENDVHLGDRGARHVTGRRAMMRRLAPRCAFLAHVGLPLPREWRRHADIAAMAQQAEMAVAGRIYPS